MREAILVPIDQCDPIEQIVPWVDNIAKPGMSVVFLVRSSVNNWAWIYAHVTAIQTGNVIALQTCNAQERARLEEEQQSAELKLAALRESLRRKGLETEVKIYAGGLKKTLANLTKDENVRFVMISGGRVNLFARLIGPVARFFNPFKRAGFSPLVLIHPDSGLASSKRA